MIYIIYRCGRNPFFSYERSRVLEIDQRHICDHLIHDSEDDVMAIDHIDLV